MLMVGLHHCRFLWGWLMVHQAALWMGSFSERGWREKREGLTSYSGA